MTQLYPLQFTPLLQQYLWGGRKLGEVLGKPIGNEADYAESWEVVDHGQDQSVVTNGPLAGTTLAQLVAQCGQELFGCHHPQPRFPLLFKFLDCNRVLSVQVHPNNQQAALQDPPDLGKTEAWVVLQADPESVLYAGLREGIDRLALESAIEEGRADQCLHRFRPEPGDCIFIPAGTVHALGAGLLVAEIQQASNTTFRLYDWNRVGADGKPRPLHVEAGLNVTDYQAGPVSPQQPQPTDEPQAQLLVCCDKFILRRWTLQKPQPLGNDGRFHLLAVIEGELQLSCGSAQQILTSGQTVLVPAVCGEISMQPSPRATLLEACLPLPSELLA